MLKIHTPESLSDEIILPGLLSTFRTVKYEHLVAGISGGVVSTLILHPLDLLKIRFAGNIV